MDRKFEILTIYLTGLLQGLVLVIVPAASLVFTDPAKFGFSPSDYGLLFIPQVIMAIVASILGPSFVQRWGMRTVLRGGLFFNLLAMILIASSQLVMANHQLAFTLVILGTGLVGAGFGSTLPTINVYASNFFPKNSASALTVLHTLLGIGTALAPFLVTIFIKQLGWWMLPVLVILALSIILISAFILPLKDGRSESTSETAIVKPKEFLPLRVRLFMLNVFLYGFCETIFANWAIIYLNKEKAVGIREAGFALAIFWVMVSVGRLVISVLSVWIPSRYVYRTLPVLILFSLFNVAVVKSSMAGMLAFGLAGLSCSAFFPLTFSFGQKDFESIAERVSGWIMAAYMLGYGLAAYGIGKIVELTNGSIGSWYIKAMIPSLAVVVLSWTLTQKQKN